MDLQLLNKTINLISGLAKKLPEKWAYIGSTASYIEGQDIIPSDIDIMTTKQGTAYFADKLKLYRIVNLYFDDSEKGSSWYVKFIINGIEVEVMGNLTVKGDVDKVSTPGHAGVWNNLNFVNFQGLSTPLFPDEFQIVTNAVTASREQRLADKANFMLKKGYSKELINNFIRENHLSEESVARIKKYLPV